MEIAYNPDSRSNFERASGIRQMKLKKYLPTRDHLRDAKSLRFLGEVIFESNLWHFNRHSVSYAALIGLFCCFLPMPFQMVPATLLCLWARCNIPLAIAFVWISNPITMPPMMYFAYRIGAHILGEPSHVDQIALSWQWLSSQFVLVWQPLLLGSLLCGTSSGLAVFATIRLYWRWRVGRNWTIRKLKRRNRLVT